MHVRELVSLHDLSKRFATSSTALDAYRKYGKKGKGENGEIERDWTPALFLVRVPVGRTGSDCLLCFPLVQVDLE